MKAALPKEAKLPSVIFDIVSREMLEYFANQSSPFEKRSKF